MTPAVSATTTVAAVIGSPVRHSLSPVLHQAAFDHLDLNWVYVAFEVDEAATPAAIAAMATLRLGGLSVTMPGKAAAWSAVDRRTRAAEPLRSVNCVFVDTDGALVGDSTDGAGFVAGLRAETGEGPGGMRVVVVGAGGAARSIVAAMGDAGAADVAVLARRAGPAAEAAALAGTVGRVADLADVSRADLVVNATPLGMAPGDPVVVAPDALTGQQIVADIVYQPTETPLLRAAARVGARRVGGLAMLVGQAAVAFEHWTGEAAPVEVMGAAAGAAASLMGPPQRTTGTRR